MERTKENKLQRFVGKRCFIKTKSGAVFKNANVLSVDDATCPVQFLNFIKENGKGGGVAVFDIAQIEEE